MSIATNVIRKLGIVGSYLPKIDEFKLSFIRAVPLNMTLDRSKAWTPPEAAEQLQRNQWLVGLSNKPMARLPFEVTEMELQTLKDSTSDVYVVTDLLRGVRYSVTDKGSHYEIEVPREAGCAKVVVSQKADVTEVADELIRLLDNADQVCLPPCTSAESSSSKDFSGSARVVHATTHTTQTLHR